MGRRSLVLERRQHIVSVTIDCVAEHGLAGTTLERIAEMAGMARGHVRHYAGNRDELLTDAARVFYFGDKALDEKDVRTAAATTPILDPAMSLGEALDYLFVEFAAPNAENPAAFAFLEAARTMPLIHAIVLTAYTGMQSSLDTIIRRSIPTVSEPACRQAAYGVVSLALGNAMIIDIEMSAQRMADARAVAQATIDQLGVPVTAL